MNIDTIRRNNLFITDTILESTSMPDISESSKCLLVAVITDLKNRYKTRAEVKEPCDFLAELADYLQGSHDYSLAQVGLKLGSIVRMEYDID